MTEQGTLGWYKERRGRITMSERVTTLMEGSVDARNSLLRAIAWEREQPDEVIAEFFEREQRAGENSEAMAWGRAHEDAAYRAFAMTRNTKVVRPGFIPHPAFPDLCGSSVDFIEYDDQGPRFCGEVKCPFKQANHLAALHYGMKPGHYNQVQGHCAVTGLEGTKFISFDPRQHQSQQLYVQLVPASAEWQDRLLSALDEFAAHLSAGTFYEKPKLTGKIPKLF